SGASGSTARVAARSISDCVRVGKRVAKRTVAFATASLRSPRLTRRPSDRRPSRRHRPRCRRALTFPTALQRRLRDEHVEDPNHGRLDFVEALRVAERRRLRVDVLDVFEGEALEVAPDRVDARLVVRRDAPRERRDRAVDLCAGDRLLEVRHRRGDLLGERPGLRLHGVRHLRGEQHAHASEVGRELNRRFAAVMEHYGASSTRIEPGESHQNGIAEKAHHVLKSKLEQALVLRGSRDFSAVEPYMAFVGEIRDRLNLGEPTELLAEERACLLPLPPARGPEYSVYLPIVRAWSTIHFAKRVYSVPSRLIGCEVEVRQYPDVVEVCFNGAVVRRRRRESGAVMVSSRVRRRFNGAVVRRRRRGGAVNVLSVSLLTLQRSRRPKTTESGPHPAKSSQGRVRHRPPRVARARRVRRSRSP